MRLAFMLVLSFVLWNCQTIVRDRMPTGVERIVMADGGVRIIATAMASEKAIEKDNIAMMQTTSKEAARLLLVAELKEQRNAKIMEKFAAPEVEFIDRGRYCRLTAVYQPPPPVQPANPQIQVKPQSPNLPVTR